MALDLGSRRTGVAVSDELGLFAHPRPALKGATRALLDAIPTLVAGEEVEEVIVGLPRSLSGEDSAQTSATRAFVERLRERLDIPVTMWDERLSTVEAARYVPSGRHRDGSLDSAAAALLLQAVLDSRAGSRP